MWHAIVPFIRGNWRCDREQFSWSWWLFGRLRTAIWTLGSVTCDDMCHFFQRGIWKCSFVCSFRWPKLKAWLMKDWGLPIGLPPTASRLSGIPTETPICWRQVTDFRCGQSTGDCGICKSYFGPCLCFGWFGGGFWHPKESSQLLPHLIVKTSKGLNFVSSKWRISRCPGSWVSEASPWLYHVMSMWGTW